MNQGIIGHTKFNCHDNFVKIDPVLAARAMPPNGPAIKGGCVTRRKHRAGSCFFSREMVTVQGGYGVLFAIFALRSLSEGGHGTNFIECWRDRGKRFLSGRVFIPVDEFGKRHWRSVAVQIVSKPEICQGAEFKLRTDERFDSRSFSEGWCPGAGLSTGPGK